jgi:uncharacterized Zn finger protein
MSYDDDWRTWPAAKPRKAKGGIKARSQRGAFGTQWWAKRWIEVLERLSIGSRLQRGRRYARAGQVLDVTIRAGKVTAKVQGSRAAPYAVTIEVATLDAAAWRKVAEHIAGEARFSARLLAGEMPHEIEEAFAAAGTSLFPTDLKQLQTECSCPDWSNPCKHIAATYYLIGEEFDRDPFLLFTLRGGTKAAVLAELHEPVPDALAIAPEAVPLAADSALFWEGKRVEQVPLSALGAEPRKRALPAFPFWRAAEPLDVTLARIDAAAVPAALALLAETAEVEG